jgi:para-aminobenzoate synthetase component 1
MPSQKSFIYPLLYFPDSAKLFAGIAGNPWAVFLDSGYPYCNQGRYDILASDPVCTLVTRGDITEITRSGECLKSDANPFDLLKQQLLPALPGFEDLPFNGGAIGYFSYDLARRLEKLPVIGADAERIPEMVVGIYEWAVIVDHQHKQSYLVGHVDDEQKMRALQAQFSQLQEHVQTDSFNVLGPIQCNMDRAAYGQAFDRIKYYLQEGDCYQVNLAQRFAANCSGNPWIAYQALRELNAAPFSCYLDFPELQVLSSSPERFLKLTNGIVETKPIKGTRPRKPDLEADQAQIRLLETSEKDRAENLMIVDLLRNDIGKTCKKGSVKVSKLFAVETYSTVHHLVSTVTGVLEQNQHALDLLKSCFPGGSITGAPKVRAMEIIEELEPNRRGVYCGAIGYIGFDGNMDTNIAIRTLVHSHNTIRFWAGGGIVNDSSVDDEYQECFDKAGALISLLNAMRFE